MSICVVNNIKTDDADIQNELGMNNEKYIRYMYTIRKSELMIHMS